MKRMSRKCVLVCVNFVNIASGANSYFTTGVDEFPSYSAHLLNEFREIRYSEFEHIALEHLWGNTFLSA
jgi:hypothetical protein